MMCEFCGGNDELIMTGDICVCLKCRETMPNCKCKCGILYFDQHEEGFFCDKCGDIMNICKRCDSANTKLVNWCVNSDRKENDYKLFSADYPTKNINKPFEAIYDGEGFYIDDSTIFYWKCLDCNTEFFSCCD